MKVRESFFFRMIPVLFPIPSDRCRKYNFTFFEKPKTEGDKTIEKKQAL